MNQTSLEAAFQEWWESSYGRPPGTHAVMTHVSFAMHVLELMELMKTAACDRQFAQIARSIDPENGFHTIDAIDNDGRAWWLIVGNENAPDHWTELEPLPSKEDRP